MHCKTYNCTFVNDENNTFSLIPFLHSVFLFIFIFIFPVKYCFVDKVLKKWKKYIKLTSS